MYGMKVCKKGECLVLVVHIILFLYKVEQYPEVAGLVRNFTFPGLGQRPTPVTDAYGVVRIANVLQGPRAVRFRDTSARILVRYLGGDEFWCISTKIESPPLA